MVSTEERVDSLRLKAFPTVAVLIAIGRALPLIVKGVAPEIAKSMTDNETGLIWSAETDGRRRGVKLWSKASAWDGNKDFDDEKAKAARVARKRLAYEMFGIDDEQAIAQVPGHAIEIAPEVVAVVDRRTRTYFIPIDEIRSIAVRAECGG